MKNLQSLGSLSNLGNPSAGAIGYRLYDKFLADLAGGSVNGTSATPNGGTRTVVDAGNKLSISSGVLTAVTGGTSNTDGIWWPNMTRLPGLMFLLDNTPGDTTGGASIGWDSNQSGAISTALKIAGGGLGSLQVLSSVTVIVGAFSAATAYKIGVILRANGTFFFIKGGAFTNWTLLFQTTDSTANMSPAIGVASATSNFTADNIRVPASLWLPASLVYDTFTRANGVLGNSETSSPDSQTIPAKAWTDTLGTWAIATNAATCSATSGGSGFATVNSGVADVLIDVAVTRSAGVAGCVLRYADSSNYIIAYHDGTNAKLDKVIAGVTTNILTAVVAYSAGSLLKVVASGTSFLLYYNTTKVGGTGTIADAAVQSTTVHGLYTTNTANILDAFTVWARGTNNEYGILDRY